MTGLLKFRDFLVANWVLLSFVVTLLVALYVRFRFRIDYFFEKYQDIAAKQKLAAFYRKLADRFMVAGEFDAAARAYSTALQMDPHDTKSTYGLVKAEVFHPEPGQSYFAPEVVDIKLKYLEELHKDDRDIHFLRGLRCMSQGDSVRARSSFHAAISKDPDFVGAYLQLGYLEQAERRVEEAIANYKKVLQLDPSFAVANNNLGHCHILLHQFADAITCLQTSLRVSPSLPALINLGNAYRYTRAFLEAIRTHRNAKELVSDYGPDTKRLVKEEWTFNYVPAKQGDRETLKLYAKFYTLQQKRAFVLYELAFDYALQGDFAEADAAFEEAYQIEHAQSYANYFFNTIVAIQTLLAVSGEPQKWFVRRGLQLMSPEASQDRAQAAESR